MAAPAATGATSSWRPPAPKAPWSISGGTASSGGKRPGRGRSQDRHGKTGPPLIIPVPLGTRVFAADGRLIQDLLAPGQRLVVAKGGRGGKGNAHFVSSRWLPRFAQPGNAGPERRLRLELQILAESAWWALPNAGKTPPSLRPSPPPGPGWAPVSALHHPDPPVGGPGPGPAGGREPRLGSESP